MEQMPARMIDEARNNNCSLLEIGLVFCSSILLLLLVVLLFNDEVLAFVQTKEGYEKLFGNLLWGGV